MDNRYYYAWLRLKGEKVEQTEGGHDWKLIDSLLTVMLQAGLPSGDGKFSRLVNYVEHVREYIAFVKANWSDDAELTTVFLMALDACFESLERTAEIIKKGR